MEENLYIKCPKCGSKNITKNGYVFGSQRYKCKVCQRQFTKITPAGKPLFLKLICHSLYVAGLSMRDISGIVGVTAQSISRWIRKWHPMYLADIGNQGAFHTVKGSDLLKELNIQKDEKMIVSSTVLPSGAQFNIVIRLSGETKKSLKK